MYHKRYFKCINNIAPSYLNHLFKMRDNLSITRRKNMLLQPKVRTTKYGLLSIRYDGARLWNNVMASNICVADIRTYAGFPLENSRSPDSDYLCVTWRTGFVSPNPYESRQNGMV